MASAGTVTLDLDANSVKMIRELQKAQRQTKRSASSMRREMGMAFKSIAKGAVVMGAAVASATKLSVDYADNIGKVARAIGLTAEQYQEHAFAAKRAGVAQGQFSSNMTAFVKRVGEAQAGMGPLVSGLKNLNPVLLENIKNARNQSEALGIVADAIKSSNSATERAAIANAAFSRSGIGMVNMLSEGSSGLSEMARKARDLGIVMSDEMVAGAEDAADKLGDLQEVLKVRVASTVLENVDAIIAMTDAITNLVIATANAVATVPNFMTWLGEEVAASLYGPAADDLIRREEEILGLEKRLAAHQKRAKQAATDVDGISVMRPQDRALEIRLKRVIALKKESLRLDRETFKVAPTAETPGEKPEIPLIPDPIDVQGDADKIAETIKNLINDITTYGASDNDKALLELIDQGATEEDIILIRQLQDEIRLLDEAKLAQAETDARRNELAAEYQQLVTSLQTPTQMHHEELQRLEEMWAAQLIPSLEEYHRLQAAINARFEETSEKVSEMSEFAVGAARSMQTALADYLFDPWDEGLKGMLKGFTQMLKRMVAEAIAAQILKSLFNQDSSNPYIAALGAAFNQGKAAGGPVSAGQAYLVGERGPEILQMGSSSGTIIPNHQLATVGGGNITNIVNLPPSVQRQTAAQVAFEVSRIQKRSSSRNS